MHKTYKNLYKNYKNLYKTYIKPISIYIKRIKTYKKTYKPGCRHVLADCNMRALHSPEHTGSKHTRSRQNCSRQIGFRHTGSIWRNPKTAKTRKK